MLILLITLVYGFGPGDDYNTYGLAHEADVFTLSNDLFQRDKCKTCCRIMFYNEKYDRVMDMEFNDKEKVRSAKQNYEQSILLRPLDNSRNLKYFELAPYKQINVYAIPRRVMDVRSGSAIGNPLIIWQKKPPLDKGTDNQRFTYKYPYNDFSLYPKHIIDFNNLCLEATDIYKKWAGNKNLVIDGKQIIAQRCADKPEQEFTIIYG